MKKKVVTLSLVVALIATAAIGGTMAFFTDKTETAVNTFTVGDVEISLDEADVDVYGEEIKDADRVIENDYKLIPGHTYVKDPTVHVADGKEAAYVRMFVTFNKYTDLKTVFGDDFLPQDYVDGTWDASKWVPFGEPKVDGDNVTYEFRYFETVATVNAAGDATGAKDLEALFTRFVLPPTLTDEDIEALAGLQISVRAEAIQADGFDGNAEAAFDALTTQGADLGDE